MIPLSREAEAQLDALLLHYERLNRVEASRNLFNALGMVSDRIERGETGLPAPRPYPALARLGLRWIKEYRYWVAYTAVANDIKIVGVFHDTADIPRRI